MILYQLKWTHPETGYKCIYYSNSVLGSFEECDPIHLNEGFTNIQVISISKEELNNYSYGEYPFDEWERKL